ncbi:DNA-binding transcriptional LysR family regulator [Mesocricetibacter intestinalis]|uniref:DNA-binding transcriptional LysR family regulator n=1 Tax=Mesocricetibacter intestinalis TaxID=1521930 RepID=A0A4R6VEV1_9PAST|nr:LysR family transcriptional regulator [Mesocricetibacter intestinalis]TDQ59505.1 DNA-binding transcriptional LysR family regulator [Mesocricetibacter intestinalis]
MYSFEQLKIFVSVCETGSFSATARRLGKVQSGISQSIANLEIELNQLLFDRSGLKPVPTEAGNYLLPVARSILQQKNYFDQKVEALENKQENQLVIGIEESLPLTSLTRILQNTAEKYPTTNLELISATSANIETMVKQGEVQLGIIYLTPEFKIDYDFFVLEHNRFITVAAPDHILANQEKITAQMLKEQRQLLLRSNRQELWFNPQICPQAWFANNHGTLLELACLNIGWAFVPAALAAPYIDAGRLIELRPEFEKSGLLAEMAAIVSRRIKRGPVLENLLTRIKGLKL